MLTLRSILMKNTINLFKREDLYYDSAFAAMVGANFSYHRQVGHFTEKQLTNLIDKEQRKDALKYY